MDTKKLVIKPQTLVYSVLSTKSGAKTTKVAKLGAFWAETCIKTLLIDADLTQPSLSNFYPLIHEAPYGIYQLLVNRRLIRNKSNLKLILVGADTWA